MNMKTHTIPFKWLAAFLFVLLFCSPPAAVQAARGSQTEQVGSLVITRTAPEFANVGQKIWVVIEVQNTGAQAADFRWVEHLGNADFDLSLAKSINIYDPDYGQLPDSTQPGFYLYYYEWVVTLQSAQTTHLAYWLIPRTPGTYVISPAQVEMDGQTYMTKSMVIKVNCVADGICQVDAAENYYSCPDDCSSGGADNYCDGAADGVIDPDCDSGYDQDDTAFATTPSAPGAEGPAWKNWFQTCLGGGAVLLLPMMALLLRLLGPRHL
jgi:hypothetical protein